MIVNTEYADIFSVEFPDANLGRCAQGRRSISRHLGLEVTGFRCAENSQRSCQFPRVTSNPEVISSPLGLVPALTPLYCLVWTTSGWSA